MKADIVASMRRQLDRRFEGASLESVLQRPPHGWIRTTRQALGMRLVDLAKRIGVTEGALRQNEAAELDESLTLKHLRRAAEAMGCELVYAFVPKTSFENRYKEQVRKRAVADAGRIARTMALESQGVSGEITNRHAETLFRDYLHGPPRDLWSG